jgi:adenosylcobinamide kinase/adenosylcobinamide-phosphate guanylyltransferase
MGKVTLILGGARSGKSHHALEIAQKRHNKKVAFIATCEPLDKEMRRRIRAHQKNRPNYFRTFEEPQDIYGLLKEINSEFGLIVIDCLTLWVSNLLLKGLGEREIVGEMKRIVAALNKSKAKSIIVSNEVGLGIVPRDKLSRDFRDIAGKINQLVAREAGEVIFMVSGLPLKIKG